MHIYRPNEILAQAAQPAAAPTSSLGFFVPLVLMIVIMYFILIRPQQQQRKRQEKLLQALKSGDKVVTSSGIVGMIITVKDKTVSLRSADTKMEVTKSSVAEILESSGSPDAQARS